MDARCNLERLTSVVLPNTLIDIGHSAFYNNELTEVIIPSSVRYIGSEAFYQNRLQNVPSTVVLRVKVTSSCEASNP